MIKLPYGLTDFYDLVTQGYLYVDRTCHIRHVEDLGRALIFIRPRRFGKSLWLKTLSAYYDVRLAGEFDRLFGGLDVGREPTPLRNRYFVLEWDFSTVDARGSVDEIAVRLYKHANTRIETFLERNRDQLAHRVEIDEDPGITLERLLSALERTPYRLYLLIDEYDNFINEVMTKDEVAYRALVYQDGPFKQLFKAVKAAAGRGLERIFITGVSPVALNDISSGFNIARDIYREPELATLCGFTDPEVRSILQRIADERGLSAAEADEALETMRIWYNGYRFSESPAEAVYNPTNALYFLDHLARRGTPPPELHDRNLALDQGKLAFLGGTRAGAGVLRDLVQGDGTLEVTDLETHFSMEDLVHRLEVDRRFMASFLYYLGLLTRVGEPPHFVLGIPNLVVRKLFLDRHLDLYLANEEVSVAQEVVLDFYNRGELEPLLAFVERKLLPALSSRDHPHHVPGRGQPASELVVKSLFLSLLWNDRRYVAVSELEVGRGHADLCLLRRPHLLGTDAFDILFELKYVAPKEIGKTGRELLEADDTALRELAQVRAAFDAARVQLRDYRHGLAERFGDALNLRCYAVVAVGLERLLGEELKP